MVAVVRTLELCAVGPLPLLVALAHPLHAVPVSVAVLVAVPLRAVRTHLADVALALRVLISVVVVALALQTAVVWALLHGTVVFGVECVAVAVELRYDTLPVAAAVVLADAFRAVFASVNVGAQTLVVLCAVAVAVAPVFTLCHLAI